MPGIELAPERPALGIHRMDQPALAAPFRFLQQRRQLAFFPGAQRFEVGGAQAGHLRLRCGCSRSPSPAALRSSSASRASSCSSLSCWMRTGMIEVKPVAIFLRRHFCCPPFPAVDSAGARSPHRRPRRRWPRSCRPRDPAAARGRVRISAQSPDAYRASDRRCARPESPAAPRTACRARRLPIWHRRSGRRAPRSSRSACRRRQPAARTRGGQGCRLPSACCAATCRARRAVRPSGCSRTGR